MATPQHRIPIERSPLYGLKVGDKFIVSEGHLTYSVSTSSGELHSKIGDYNFIMSAGFFVTKVNPKSIIVEASTRNPSTLRERVGFRLNYRRNQVMPMNPLKIKLV